MNSFEKSGPTTQEAIPLSRFEDVRGLNLSQRDFSRTPIDILMSTDFDTQTQWPSKEKLPAGFEPEKFLEESKNPGLGMRELHKGGVDAVRTNFQSLQEAIYSI